MATNTHGSFAETTSGTYKILKTPALSHAVVGTSRTDAYVSPTISAAIGGRSITGAVTVTGAGEKGTQAVAATTSFTFDDAAWTAATKADAIDCATLPNSSTARITFNVPTAALGDDANHVIQACNDTNGSTSAGAGVIGIGTSGASASTIAEAIVDAINGVTNARVHFGSGTTIGGIAGLTASLGTGGTKVTLTAVAKGAVGNDITIANTAGSVATAGNLAGGTVTAPSSAYIELTSTDGTKIQYTPVASGADPYLNQFNLGVNATGAAGNLETLIENTNKGHGSKISVSRPYGAITLTQATAGAAGNTAITLGGNFGAYLSINPGTTFTGGADRTKVDFVLQTSVDGVNWSSNANSIVLIADIDLGSTGTYVGTVTKENVPSAPFFRTGLNVDQTNNIAGGGGGLTVDQSLSYDTYSGS